MWLLYNPRDFKYQAGHPLVCRRSNGRSHKKVWYLSWKLSSWSCSWSWFHVDCFSTLSAISVWKLHILQSWIFRDIAILCYLPKKLACLANYQERRSFPWPLVQVYASPSVFSQLWPTLQKNFSKVIWDWACLQFDTQDWERFSFFMWYTRTQAFETDVFQLLMVSPYPISEYA